MDERIALITGAAKGIGLEAARQLGRAGWQVVVAARAPEQAEAAAARLGAEGISAWSWN
jgi:NAD(P)-dependent dehydrogenase (short-subunit alcohol dehydrogenase family)